MVKASKPAEVAPNRVVPTVTGTQMSGTTHHTVCDITHRFMFTHITRVMANARDKHRVVTSRQKSRAKCARHKEKQQPPA